MNEKKVLNKINEELKDCEHNIKKFEELTGYSLKDMLKWDDEENDYGFEAGYYYALKTMKKIIGGD